MNLRLVDYLQAKFSPRYLEWAERFAWINWGPVKTLRVISKNLKIESENAYSRSRAPNGVTLTYHGFRLFEMFHLESFEPLYKGLVRLLPSLVEHPLHRTFTSDFHQQSQSLTGTSWEKLGYLVRDEIPFRLGEPYRKIPELPSEVRLIEVDLHRLLPSIYAVTFDVQLNQSATEQLIQIHDRHYLPMVRFHKSFPFTRSGSTFYVAGFSSSNAEDEMSREIFEWSDSLRSRVEKSVRPFFSGYFRKRKAHMRSRLPAIDLYTLNGAPEDRETFNKWAESTRLWLQPFGFSQPHETYSNNSLLFSWSTEQHAVGAWPHRLVVMRQPFIKSLDLDLYGNDENAAISYEAKYTVDALTRPIALTEYLQSIQTKIEKIRTTALGSMNSSRRLKTYLDQSGTIQRESHLLERLSLEVTQERRLIERRIEPLKDFVSNFPGEAVTLKEASLKATDARIDFLKTQLTYIRNSFSDFVELRNMTVNYSLQRYVFWLTLIATFAAMVSVVASLPAIKQFWNELRRVLLP